MKVKITNGKINSDTCTWFRKEMHWSMVSGVQKVFSSQPDSSETRKVEKSRSPIICCRVVEKSWRKSWPPGVDFSTPKSAILSILTWIHWSDRLGTFFLINIHLRRAAIISLNKYIRSYQTMTRHSTLCKLILQIHLKKIDFW